MNELVNGCKDEKTLELMGKFSGNPHCHTFSMGICEDCGAEYIYVGFTHYSESYTAKLYSETGIGEIYFEDEWCSEYYGEITADNLVELLNRLPHIADFMTKGGK